ncbi:MAG: DNA repair ATPase [Bacteroidota bacterium]
MEPARPSAPDLAPVAGNDVPPSGASGDGAPAGTAPNATPALEGGTYELLRDRLAQHARTLQTRLQTLDEARRAVFGSTDLALIGTAAIATHHNAVVRDLVEVPGPDGPRLLVGCHVHLGLKTETTLDDVFAAYAFDGDTATYREAPLDVLADERFAEDFANLHRYYKQARFARFAERGPHLFMVFQVGQRADDIKVFKWLRGDDGLQYLDNRSEHTFVYPTQQAFRWQRTTRDMHRDGAHPHVSIEDRVFVEAVGGDLTVKVEDNTDSGLGVYAEPVDHADQTLDDAEVHYATAGPLILMRIRPYQEETTRQLLFNEKTQAVHRLDALAHATVALPEDHGIVYPDGFALAAGGVKRFDGVPAATRFERQIAAPNGEDFLFVFHDVQTGEYVLLSYNLITQEVATPVRCGGYALRPDGELVYVRPEPEPSKHHTLQRWRSPYRSRNGAPLAGEAPRQQDAYLFKVGNKDIVRALSEGYAILNLLGRDDGYVGLYADLVKETTGLLDATFWLDHEEAGNVAEVLRGIRETAQRALAEFDKVRRLRQTARERTQAAAAETQALLQTVERRTFESVEQFVDALAELRAVRGRLIALREVRYADVALAEALETEAAEASERLARRMVEFLLRDDALAPYEAQVAEAAAAIDALDTVAEARGVAERFDTAASALDLLIETVSNLQIDDATQTTRIIDAVSGLYATLNAERARLKRRRDQLAETEGAAEFAAQLKLLEQAVTSYLDVAETPEACEQYLTRAMVQVSELESRFAEADRFIEVLSERREEVYAAFEQKRLALVEARSQRTAALERAAERILDGVRSRLDRFDTVEEINGYLAADLMVAKVRDTVAQLRDLGDATKADGLQTALKAAREQAIRQLKDRKELFVDGQPILRLGTHRFAVNTQPLDLTTVLRDERLHLHLTGTGFFEPLDDPAIEAARYLWTQEVVSETDDVYRAEYLAYLVYQASLVGQSEIPPPTALLAEPEDDEAPDAVLASVQRFMAPRYGEGYVKGVHDHDAATILRALLRLHADAGLLRYGPAARACALVWWHCFADDATRTRFEARLRGLGTVQRLFSNGEHDLDAATAALAIPLVAFVNDTGLFEVSIAEQAAAYLARELAQDDPTRFVASPEAVTLLDGFAKALAKPKATKAFGDALDRLIDDPAGQVALLRDALSTFANQQHTASTLKRSSPPGQSLAPAQAGEGTGVVDRAGHKPDRTDSDLVDEAAAIRLADLRENVDVGATETRVELADLRGSHARVDDGTYRLDFAAFLDRLGAFARERVPAFAAFAARKHERIQARKAELRLDELKPRVFSGFVRNRLIDRVFLPLIGDNLAKQLGTAGDTTRTDRQGLLLLISPPGYGKTTLMEYLADRLGLTFVKINGPAIGHDVTALDPESAPNAAAREELVKLNLAFEIGDNLMLYVDDIQHCHPEFLQKFIALCDAQRRVEGVWRGQPRTYDLRGKKVAVVMAGNPYTESGARFRVPDMLANRADTYNLGDVIGETADAFASSYLENAMGANPVLDAVASRAPDDLHALVQAAETDRRDGLDLQGNYAPDELDEILAVLRHLIALRDVVLGVNQEYIASAAQNDAYRTRPPFLLQGSYRNMNRLAEKVLPAMTDAERDTLVRSHYEQEAQLLTSGAEANLLRLKELMGWLTPDEAARWAEMQATFQKNQAFAGLADGDQVAQVLAQLAALTDGLAAIRDVLARGDD